MNTVDEINAAWGWVGMSAVEVLGENDFGNLIIRDDEGKYWRLRPHDLCCQPVAENSDAFHALSYNQAFLQDWYMTEEVMLARATLGPLANGRKYCMKVPSAAGGEVGGDNLATAPLMALIRFSGDVAQHMEGLPTGNHLNAPYVE
ncbi:MAG: T6SS immunity protein Tdi1 domain-containing protein [Massilia sp.]